MTLKICGSSSRLVLEELADTCDPRVVDDLEVRRRQDVEMLKRRLQLLGVLHHRPELEHPEPRAV